MIALYKKAITEEEFAKARDLLIVMLKSNEYSVKQIEMELQKTVNLNSLKNPLTDIVTSKVYLSPADMYAQAKLTRVNKPSFRLKGIKLIRYINDNVPLSINWAMYKKMLRSINKYYLVKKYKINIRVWDQKMLKNLSVFMLEKGPSVDEDFHLMVGIENLYGYNHEALEESQLEKLKAWVQNDFKPRWQGSTELYLKQFREEVAKVLRWKDATQLVDTTIEQFCVNIAQTGTTGSAFDPGGPRATVSTPGDPNYKIINNKFSKSAVLSVENKVQRILTNKEQKAKVSVKVEPVPKVRLIISSDFNMHLKMRFIDTWLARWMNGNPESTLWQTKEQTKAMWLKFCNMGDWNIPIDQSAFDHHISQEMVLGMLEEIKSLILERAIAPGPVEQKTKDELLQTMDTIIYGMENCTLSYLDPVSKMEHVLQYRSGILSGWQWTAFLDTLANIAQKNLAIRQTAEEGLDISMIYFNAQGDDQLTQFAKLWKGILYWLTLTTAGYDIHPSKNFFSTKHNEYLRKYSTELGINGYPARMINKLMWLYPGKQEVVNTHSLLNNIYSRWDKLKERCYSNWLVFKQYLFSDYIGAKINKETYYGFLGAKRIYGGKEVSFVPKTNLSLSSIPGTWQYHIGIHGEGYRQFQEIFGEYQSREMDDWYLQAVQLPDVIKHVEIKSKSELTFQEVEDIEPLEFALTNDVEPILKPQLIEGWKYNEIFSQSNEIMLKLFPRIDTFIEQGHAPKSWIYDFILGKLKVVLPQVDGFSEEGVSLAFEEYVTSVTVAMYMKKYTDDKWNRLQEYVKEVFPIMLKRDQRYPAYFYV